MADERIDIEVTDKVDAGVAKKLNQIADAADRGETHLQRLKSALAAVNSSALDRLASAMAKADSAQARLLNAQARLTTAQNAGSIAASKVALAQQKIATEAARTEAAQQRAAAATTAAEGAATRLAAAQQRAAGASQAAASATQQSAAAAGQAGAAYTGAAAGAARFAGAQTQAAAASNAATAASQRVATGLRGAGGAHDQYARAARQTNSANANIIAQMQDIGVSLAGGQNPLLVLIQQGSQLSYIASTMEGGWTKIISVMGRLLLRFAPLIAAFGALWLAMDRIKDQADVGMDKYIQTLGLTDKEVKKLKDTHVTSGDVIKATWQVVSEDIMAAAGLSTEQIKSFWADAVDFIISFMKGLAVAIYGIVAGIVKFVAVSFMNIAKLIGNAGILAKNLFMKSIEALINLTIKGLNAIGSAVNTFSEAAGFGKVVGALSEVELATGGVTDGLYEIEQIGFSESIISEAQRADKYLGQLDDRIRDRARKLRQDDLRKQADEIISDRTPKAGDKGKQDNSAQKRIDELNKLNLGLDNEIARMKMLKDERAIQQRMDSIEESLTAKKIKLNEQERATILAKVTAIEMYKYQQAEMDRIYEETTGPLRTLNAATAAANALYGRGTITLEQYNAQLLKASDAYKESTDPLFKFNEEIRKGNELLGKYGIEMERAIYLQGVEAEYRTPGLSIYDASTGKLRTEVALLVAKNDALRQGQFIQSQLAGVLAPIMEQNQEIAAKQAVYAELDRLRGEDLNKESNYQRAKAALYVKYNQEKLDTVAGFFGALAQVTAKGHGVVGAISKAAAVAEATIQGYLAVQKALASAPPPFNMIAAAAIAIRTGANVARILSTNAGSFATGGQFMVDGKSGVDANNINMNVTRGERVTVETPAQQRANDNGSDNGPPVINLKNVNVLDPREALAALNSSEGDQVMINFIERNTTTVRQLLGSN